MRILITGMCGFIGFHVANRLAKNNEIYGIDNLNDYYDSSLKKHRLEKLVRKHKTISFERVSVGEYCRDNVEDFDLVIHLAAHSGVRGKPGSEVDYSENNIMETQRLFEWCRKNDIRQVLFASSSSVYGGADDQTDESCRCFPESMYAITKHVNEQIAEFYVDNYDMDITALRFFTVYGPYGRPDMAVSLFTDAILKGKVVKLFGYGRAERDFIYIDDLVSGIEKLIPHINGLQVYNIGATKPVTNLQLANVISMELGMGYRSTGLPLQPGEVMRTYASIDKMVQMGWCPQVEITEGIKKYVAWHRKHYKL